jgi:hypothetical protein
VFLRHFEGIFGGNIIAQNEIIRVFSRFLLVEE